MLYGLPGAGKTSLCNAVAEKHGYFYADIGTDPQFGQGTPMWQIAFDQYKRCRPNINLITEGVLSTRDRRARLASKIWKKSRELGKGYRLYEPVLFWVKEPLEVLNSRRPSRSVEAYRELEENFEIGSDLFQHFIIDSVKEPALRDLDARVTFIMDKVLNP